MIDLGPWVIKVGGRELRPGPDLEKFTSVLRHEARAGRPLVVVHGGGDEVTDRANALGIPTQRRDGQRVTDEAMLEVVVEVLAGRVNTRLVSALAAGGVPAVGVSGVSDRLLTVRPAGDPPGSLGRVGEPTAVHARRLRGWLSEGLVPVVAPLGTDDRGGVYNVNADRAAGAIAAALGAELRIVTDVASVRDSAGRPIAVLSSAEARELVRAGAATEGMIPKLEAATASLEGGAAAVWIGDLEGLGPGRRPTSYGTRLVLAPARRTPPRPAANPASSPWMSRGAT